jgi:hypothetical protein
VRLLAALLTLLVVASCQGGPPLRTGAPASDLVLPTAVPNGKVEVVVRSTYTVGETVRAIVRLIPTKGSLRGPLDPYIQASGFHGTATVRHLSIDPISVYAGSAETVVLWDMRDDAGKAVGGDDYSLVFTVVDDSGRTTTVGATLQVR